MSKVFTITEGLENLGAMKTGGQGSVYKGKRVGEIITAIKLIPTPIISESTSDKSYVDFTNEVAKLKRVNEEPHPNVVTILSSGVSDTGNFPFIEMEYIEGPDLEDLLKPPHDPVFKVKDVCKVAEHVSNALAHCHKYGVKHGDIKSNNIKFNINTGNYVLLDFGLSVMSDEQRRTSLRNAGAIEFMAPEQNEGQILYQTDVYSFGVILFELLAGRVPFPLNDKTESARNIVRVSHMETEVPDILSLRRQHLPAGWSEEQVMHEMNVPEWLLDTVYKCLEKQPENRFADGIALHEHIIHARNTSVKTDEALALEVGELKRTNKQLASETVVLKQTIQQYEQQLAFKDRELQEAKLLAGGGLSTGNASYIEEGRNRVSRSAFMVVLILALAFAGLAAYSYFGRSNANEATAADLNQTIDSAAILDASGNMLETKSAIKEPEENEDVVKTETETEQANQNPVDSVPPATKDTATTNNNQQQEPETGGGRYKVTSKAYFYNEADESSRTNDYIIPGNVIVRAIEDEGDFIFIRFRTEQNEIIEGWVRKKDLSKLN